ncbi:putative delta-60 repeat protein [Dokdonella fugitiva]|uniref:Putative delta-60 repeat protein n=1 Tax=Dokdonella fugitiva TaxID=328517 RepID=A0A839EZQ5_9GAMM|nr:hypothetical protein [Dokdonella fugitiva]MBA8889295.1 putative delta-60 repeat protein [Dokdonella fugitiva]
MSSRRPSKLRFVFIVALAYAAGDAHAVDGALDPTFGTGGVARVGLAGTALQAVAARPDGRIVACGTWDGESTGSKIVVFQLLADGTPDREFGADGMRLIIATSEPALCTGIALQPDGRVIVSGRSMETMSPPSWSAVRIVARLTPNGAFDPTFAGGTGIHTSHSGYANALALQRDGKILVAGYGATFITSLAADFQVMRLLPDGSMDTTFGYSGVAIAGLAVFFDRNIATAIAVDQEGRAVIAGTSTITGANHGRMAAVRFQPDGRLDTTFGTGGEMLGPPDSEGLSIAVQRNGALALSGSVRDFSDTIAMAMRVLDDGSIDTGFGDIGVTRLRWTEGTRQWSTVGAAVTIQQDDRIVVAGSAHLLERFGLLGRLDGSGRLDPTFGVSGMETIDADHIVDPPSSFTAVALSSGRIVAAGSAADGNGNYVGAIARFESDLIFADGF